jgi:threonine/homoserine/homoserine lactone efflux protein
MTFRSVVAVFVVLSTLLVPTLAAAQGLNKPVTGIQGVAQGVGAQGVINAIVNVLNMLLMFVALLAAIYLIYGGVKYITSAGDATKADEAKSTILYALLGLIVIGLSAVLVNFVLGAVAQ